MVNIKRIKVATNVSHEENKPIHTNGNDSELEIIATSRSLGLYPIVKNYSNILEGE